MTETSQARGFANARRETLSRRDGREPDYRWPGAIPWGQQSPAVEEQAVPSAPPFGARGVQFAKTNAKSARGRKQLAAPRRRLARLARVPRGAEVGGLTVST